MKRDYDIMSEDFEIAYVAYLRGAKKIQRHKPTYLNSFFYDNPQDYIGYEFMTFKRKPQQIVLPEID